MFGHVVDIADTCYRFIVTFLCRIRICCRLADWSVRYVNCSSTVLTCQL